MILVGVTFQSPPEYVVCWLLSRSIEEQLRLETTYIDVLFLEHLGIPLSESGSFDRSKVRNL